MNISKIGINEIFESIQGEGTLTGCLTLFIRTQGCNVGCKWCDSKLTWTPSEKADKLKRNENKDIFWKSADLHRYILDNASKSIWVCFTGGEPLEQIKSIKWIIEKLHHVGYRRLTIETSGFPIGIDRIDLIDLYNYDVFFSLSPKLHSALGKRFDYEELLLICNAFEDIVDSPFKMQFKFVVSDAEDLKILEKLMKDFKTIHQIFIQVEAGKVSDKKFVKKCYGYISKHPYCKLTIQEHTVLGLK